MGRGLLCKNMQSEQHIKNKILGFLNQNPPVAHRMTPGNIARHIGELANESGVRLALEELVRDGFIKHRLAKNMQYWVEIPK